MGAFSVGPIQPTSSVIITKSDVTDLTGTCTLGLFVGTAGDVVGQLVGDTSDRTWKAQSGQYLYGSWKFVKNATTATNIIGYNGN